MKHKIDIVGKLKLQSIEIVQVPKDILVCKMGLCKFI